MLFPNFVRELMVGIWKLNVCPPPAWALSLPHIAWGLFDGLIHLLVYSFLDWFMHPFKLFLLRDVM